MTESLAKKVDFGIRLIQNASKIAADNGTHALEVAYSGGKDSDCLLRLTQMAGVPYRAIYKNTTIDPPGTIQHALQNGCEIIRPEWTFAHLMQLHGMPSRFVRFCCKKLKEYKVLDYALMGIRRNESAKRAMIYQEPEQCRVYSAKEKVRAYYPLLDWTSDDVAEFAKAENIQCHQLYYDDDGSFHVERRLGACAAHWQVKKNALNSFSNIQEWLLSGYVTYRYGKICIQQTDKMEMYMRTLPETCFLLARRSTEQQPQVGLLLPTGNKR